jgi:hypothetical protein
MYRVGAAFPGVSILRIGTVDDFQLHETKLRPRVEQFVESRVAWLRGVEGIPQIVRHAFEEDGMRQRREQEEQLGKVAP